MLAILLYIISHIKIASLTLSKENNDESESLPNGQDPKPARELLLNELKLQHQQEWELRKNLDDKAKNIISLVFGFATFMTRESNNVSLQSLEHLKNVLTTSIIFIILSIFFSALSLKLQNYELPFSHANFYDKKKKGFDQDKIDAAVDASVIVFD
jgi:hypothetical protein